MLRKCLKGLLVVIGIFLILMFIATGNKHKVALVDNVNRNKSVKTSFISYNDTQLKVVTTTIYDNFSDVISNASSGTAAFVGKLTSYGPDCIGCGGHTACKPNQDVRNGNIYYDDATYGKIRIVAADKAIPCGSIIRMSNISLYSGPVIAIVLDRGGAIKGKHLDLLFTSEYIDEGFRSANDIEFDILRWGY
jgi:3D (Asp-Asp-Asp) domain-containing protein